MINIIRYLINHKDVFVLFIACLLSSILFFSNHSNQVRNIKNNLSNYYSILVGPIFWYNNVFDLKKQNALLQKNIAELKLEKDAMNSFLYENISLKKMLDYKNDSEFELKLGKIISHNLSPTINSFSIDIGKDNNILSNLPVMDMNGIIGKIFSVNKKKAVIQLITDKNFRISIRVGENRTLGIFTPTYSKYGIIEGIPKSQIVKKNDMVFTSGISDIYPPNIPVAKVVSTYIDNNQFFQNVTVEILADIYNPEFAFVIQ